MIAVGGGNSAAAPACALTRGVPRWQDASSKRQRRSLCPRRKRCSNDHDAAPRFYNCTPLKRALRTCQRACLARRARSRCPLGGCLCDASRRPAVCNSDPQTRTSPLPSPRQIAPALAGTQVRAAKPPRNGCGLAEGFAGNTCLKRLANQPLCGNCYSRRHIQI